MERSFEKQEVQMHNIIFMWLSRHEFDAMAFQFKVSKAKFKQEQYSPLFDVNNDRRYDT